MNWVIRMGNTRVRSNDPGDAKDKRNRVRKNMQMNKCCILFKRDVKKRERNKNFSHEICLNI